MPRGKNDKNATEALSKLNLNETAEDDDDSQSEYSEDESYQEEAPKSILRRVCGMKKIFVSICRHHIVLRSLSSPTCLSLSSIFIPTLPHRKDELEEVKAQYKKERIALEKKYAELRKPLMKKNDEVISGELDFDESVFDGAEEGMITNIDNSEVIGDSHSLLCSELHSS